MKFIIKNKTDNDVINGHGLGFTKWNGWRSLRTIL